jgi:predicted RNase H-like nuclease (RuvC/YqgF family)
METASANMRQFAALRKTLEEKCANVPKLQKEVEDLKQKLKESLLVAEEVAKAEQMIKYLAVDHERLKAEAHLRAELEASTAALKQKERIITKLSDEIMVSKLQATLKLKIEKHEEISNVEAAKELLGDVSFWRKKCIKAEAELHELKVVIAADARRSFLALALAPRSQLQGEPQQAPRGSPIKVNK